VHLAEAQAIQEQAATSQAQILSKVPLEAEADVSSKTWGAPRSRDALPAERLGSGDGERKTLMTRQMRFEPLPASVLFGLALVMMSM